MSFRSTAELPELGGAVSETCGKGQASRTWEQTLIFQPPSDDTPVPCDSPEPMDLCGSPYPASHVEMMRSPCAPAAVATNKSSLLRVRGWDVLIALLICSFAPRQHLINTSGRREKAYVLQRSTLIVSKGRETKL